MTYSLTGDLADMQGTCFQLGPSAEPGTYFLSQMGTAFQINSIAALRLSTQESGLPRGHYLGLVLALSHTSYVLSWGSHVTSLCINFLSGYMPIS